jgi:hypothetical protein
MWYNDKVGRWFMGAFIVVVLLFVFLLICRDLERFFLG